MNNLKVWFVAHKTTTLLIGALIILGVLGFIGIQNFTSNNSTAQEEIDLSFDAEGPYALLFPRRDGNALVLNLKRTASYDSITYELAYTSKAGEVAVSGNKIKEETGDGDSLDSQAIDRGVAGTIDTKDKKGEYEQEILFGTCSKNVCKYDQGVENGTLTLHVKKGNSSYRMITQWHLQKPDVALADLTSGDGHLKYKVDADRQTLSGVGFTIINDVTGLPKLPLAKVILGKVYALNVPLAKQLPSGNLTLELAENPPAEAKIYRFDGTNWRELDTKIEGSNLSAKADGAGIFAVLTPKK